MTFCCSLLGRVLSMHNTHASDTLSTSPGSYSVSLEKGADHSEGPARSVAMHEAAVFAHLAGNTELLLSSDLTQSWEDQVN